MEKLAAASKGLAALVAAVLALVSLFTEVPATLDLPPDLLAAAFVVLGPVLTWAVPNKVRATLTGALVNVAEAMAVYRERSDWLEGKLLQQMEADNPAALLTLRRSVIDDPEAPGFDATGRPRKGTPPPKGRRFAMPLGAVLLCLVLGACAPQGLRQVIDQVRDHPELLAARAAMRESCGDPLAQPLAERELVLIYQDMGLFDPVTRVRGAAVDFCGASMIPPATPEDIGRPLVLEDIRLTGPADLPSPVPVPRPDGL